ncbi:MAG TPA: hypothetical protein VM123_14385, partial [archaeon]|nr:hypothetical protein [archaeon]
YGDDGNYLSSTRSRNRVPGLQGFLWSLVSPGMALSSQVAALKLLFGSCRSFSLGVFQLLLGKSVAGALNVRIDIW